MKQNNLATKDTILQVASNIFKKFGFQKTTVDEIAHAARKAKGSIYYYFKNKDDIFQAVVENEYQHLKNELLKVVDKKENSLFKLKEFFLTRIQIMCESQNFTETLNNEYFKYFNFAQNFSKKFEALEKNFIKSILSEGVKNDELIINNIDISTQALIITFNGFENQYFVKKNSITNLENEINEIFNIIFNGIKKTNL
ncbi:MAG: TetR/AcrR family transcriptional regulator [Bacteroidetes bacterium]|nr:TetR/AcrR family transcriptional regulator [Bacteroidota bacterium]